MGWKAEKKLWALQKDGSDFDLDFLTLTDSQAIKVIQTVGSKYPGTSFSVDFEEQRWKVSVCKAKGEKSAFYSGSLGQAVMSAWLYVSEYVFEVNTKGNARTVGV